MDIATKLNKGKEFKAKGDELFKAKDDRGGAFMIDIFTSNLLLTLKYFSTGTISLGALC
jgi:hypothetical protein